MSHQRNAQIVRRVADALINEGYHITCMTKENEAASLTNSRDPEAVVEWFSSVSNAMLHVRRDPKRKYPDAWVQIELGNEPQSTLMYSYPLASCLAAAVQYVADSYGVGA